MATWDKPILHFGGPPNPGESKTQLACSPVFNSNPNRFEDGPDEAAPNSFARMGQFNRRRDMPVMRLFLGVGYRPRPGFPYPTKRPLNKSRVQDPILITGPAPRFKGAPTF